MKHVGDRGLSIPVLLLRNAKNGEAGIDADVCDDETGNLTMQMLHRAATSTASRLQWTDVAGADHKF